MTDEPLVTAPDPAPAEPSAGPEAPASPASPPGGAPTRRRLGRWWRAAGVAIAALVVIVLAPLASRDPDGLNRVAEDQGFIGQAENFLSGVLGGYAIPGISDPNVSKVLSGLLGIVIILAIVFVLGRVLARRRA